jgi:hypothetical protein
MSERDQTGNSGNESRTAEYQLPPLPALAAVAGFGIITGWFVSQVAPGSNPRANTFRNYAWYTGWSCLSAINVAIWLLLGAVGLWRLRLLLAEEGGDRSTRVKRIAGPLFGYIAYGTLVTMASQLLTQKVTIAHLATLPLNHFALRADLLTSLAVLGSIPNALGILVIRRRSKSLGVAAQDSQESLQSALDQYLRFENLNQQFLAMLATVIATAVAQTSALRNALIGSDLISTNAYPTEFVLLYGAIFALAVTGVYLPSELSLREAGRRQQAAAVQQWVLLSPERSTDDIEHWLDQTEQRDRIGGTLRLNVGVLSGVQTSLGLLAPLLVAFATTLLPH